VSGENFGGAAAGASETQTEKSKQKHQMGDTKKGSGE
jgi:hypothetical protein